MKETTLICKGCQTNLSQATSLNLLIKWQHLYIECPLCNYMMRIFVNKYGTVCLAEKRYKMQRTDDKLRNILEAINDVKGPFTTQEIAKVSKSSMDYVRLVIRLITDAYDGILVDTNKKKSNLKVYVLKKRFNIDEVANAIYLAQKKTK